MTPTDRPADAGLQVVVGNEPLTWWQQGWRLLIALAISATGWANIAGYQVAENHAWLFIDLSLGLLSFILVFWRRRYPLAVATITTIFSTISFSSSGPATLALVSLSTRRRWREIIPVAALAVLLAVVQNELSPPPYGGQTIIVIPFALAIVGVTVGWGLYIGSRRELIATLHDRATRAESEQAMQVSQARTAERARIAREMHDVMAHRISMVTMHAGALAYRDDLSPEQVHQTASLIQKTSHQALNELREVLGVLRADSVESPSDRPQPRATDITELIEQSRAVGMTIRTELDVELGDVPATVGRTMYRIVQESLTNARKHAQGAAVLIQLTGGPQVGLSFAISNPKSLVPSAVPGSGHGLIGLAERAELVGGRLGFTNSPKAGFAVEGWLPWPT